MYLPCHVAPRLIFYPWFPVGTAQLKGCWWHHRSRVIFLAGDTQAYFQQNFNVLWASISSLSLGKCWPNQIYMILIYLKNNHSEVSSPLDFSSSRNNDMKIEYRNLSGVSNMADKGRVTIQNFCQCNLLIAAHGGLTGACSCKILKSRAFYLVL